jgi:hypothetical protein
MFISYGRWYCPGCEATTRRPRTPLIERVHVSDRLRLAERRRTSATWHDGDLWWLGLLLSVLSAALVVGLVWWLVS